jgi:hypothetical protein
MYVPRRLSSRIICSEQPLFVFQEFQAGERHGQVDDDTGILTWGPPAIFESFAACVNDQLALLGIRRSVEDEHFGKCSLSARAIDGRELQALAAAAVVLAKVLQRASPFTRLSITNPRILANEPG